MKQSSLILFDGVCNLCCGWVMFLIKLDKMDRFKFASLQSEKGKAALLDINFPFDEQKQ